MNNDPLDRADDHDIVEVFGSVNANLSMSQIVLAVFAANMATAAVLGTIWLIVTAFS